jgi:hypothetical protein
MIALVIILYISIAVGMDDKDISFWSCLQDIQEGLQELAI